MTDTPYLVVDAARLEANIRAVAEYAHAAGVQLRPHAKTHKCAEIARRQLEAGAVGLTVATIGEAEAFADAGCPDLFIAYPLWLTRGKGQRLRALADRVSLRLAVDSVGGATQLATELSGAAVEVVVEVDSGQHRTGVAPILAGEVAMAASTAGFAVVGVFTFPGHGYAPGDGRRLAAEQESAALTVAADALRSRGIEPRVRSGGSTPTVAFTAAGTLTEIRPGVYPFNDAQQVELGSCGFGEVALWANATVVHRAGGTRIVVDAGSKILGADRAAWASGFGRLLDHPTARITALSEHHATIDFEGAPNVPVELGDIVRLVPNHVCNAVNLVDELVIAGTDVRWPIIARGANS